MNRRILLIYPPLRSNFSTFLPTGILLIAHALRQEGADVKILNLDVERLSPEGTIQRVMDIEPEIIGFSAVTSTTYLFIKETIVNIRKAIGKDIHFIVGGNIVASAEILIRDANVDTCFFGESYWTVKDFFRAYDFHQHTLPEEEAKKIPGIAYKCGNDVIYSGRRKVCNINEIPLLRNFDDIDIDQYFTLIERMDFSHYPAEAKEKINSLPEGSRFICTIFCSGCQNKCSFCHRNIPGIRQRNVKDIFEYIDYLTSCFNIRFINFCDESLFFSERWLNEFTQELLKRNIVYKFAGVRADRVVRYKDYLKQMAGHGLVDIAVGLETGNKEMLDIMNKNVTVEDNLKAIEIINDLRVYHVPQIILGMPGENPASIKETLRMVDKCKTNSSLSSINIIQVLPGTPVYWFAKKNGRICDETSYLESISDKNPIAEGTVNVTEYSMSVLEYAQFHMAHKIKFENKWYGSVLLWIYDLAFLFREFFKQKKYSYKEKFSLALYALTGHTFKTEKYIFPPSGPSLRKEVKKNISDLGPLDKIKYGC